MRRPTRSTLLSLLVLALGIIIPAVAGGETRCDTDADACVKYMIDNLDKKGWIGVELKYEEGAVPRITRVLGDSPAETAGLEEGDELVALDGIEYATSTEEQLRQAKQAMVPGREVRLTVRRNGEELELPLTLGRIPHAVLAQWIGNHLLEQHAHQYETASVD